MLQIYKFACIPVASFFQDINYLTEITLNSDSYHVNSKGFLRDLKKKTMTTIIENNELDAELQDLYLQSKQWIPDLKFLEKEIEILKIIFTKNSKSKPKKDIECLLATAQHLNTCCENLQFRVKVYLQSLEELIFDPLKPFSLQIIEAHSLFAGEIKNIFVAYYNYKDEGLSLQKHH